MKSLTSLFLCLLLLCAGCLSPRRSDPGSYQETWQKCGNLQAMVNAYNEIPDLLDRATNQWVIIGGKPDCFSSQEIYLVAEALLRHSSRHASSSLSK